MSLFLFRSPSFGYIKDILLSLASSIPDISAQTRKELDMWEYNFKEPIEWSEVKSFNFVSILNFRKN